MWEIDSEKKGPVYQKIVELILSYIKDGLLLPGEKLPAERKLAESFGVNRSTVVHALDELEAMGVIIRKRGSGTTVNEGRWGVFSESSTNWRNYLAQGAFNHSEPYLEKINEQLSLKDKEVIDGYTGELPLELVPALELPNVTWKEFLMEESQQDDLGYLPLRKEIITLLQRENDLFLSESEVLLTSGAQQALFLLVQVLLRPGDAVAIEEPSFFYPLSIFQAAGIRLFGVAVDNDGMKVDSLEQKIIRNKIKMVLINPNFQNPTGTTMTIERRKRLIEVCQKHKIPIVEDDAFGQLYYQSENRPTLLKELDHENVIYIGTLSKVLGSTTKIGWLSAPARVVEKLAEARQEMDFTLSIFPQVLASYALANPLFPEKIELLRQNLIQRRDIFIDLLKEYLAEEFTYIIPTGGYYIWLTSLVPDLKRRDLDILIDKKLLTVPSFIFGVNNQSLRINYARLNETDSLKVVKILKEASIEWQKK